MDSKDIEILDILDDDARSSVEDIANMVDLDVDEVESRISRLEDEGVIKKYMALIDWDKAGEESVYAAIELNVELSRESGYDDIAERIARFPEVETIRLISGENDLQILVRESSMKKVSSFVAEKISPLESVRDTVTHFVLKTYKEDGEVFFESEDNKRLSVSP
ncbi:Lrp/AsnC family transcriptional regulator [Methanonatronarchaeum sp. AMET6-2]|uniref:Lrp/AsnC family transcriptional regulator n=1 Tax=Methanonatronarchaeum sp. AMET6-2 TaxID=2933293 RepID=UPI001201724B|nr:Lrp/AsnC family transcriptional regulator [Methanonatronarchaeum sp. AMET6-2]RZN60853.1 MAG: Lrp/AsnC family transcriptional regulator [Methanonatronarchaeia archaeon]UOY09551.1 Lrp/AsnC family transcriptional regulator [Methanonatronarchaeum sp. AMET6-2]